MSLFTKLKGAFKRMFGPKTIENVIRVSPAISARMKDNIELWEAMYTDNSPWLDDKICSAGLGSLIASEKARTATIEMEIKVTGESEMAKFMSENFKKVLDNIREQLEYGIALGSLVIKPYVVLGPYDKYLVDFNFTKATNFYPLSFSSDGSITEAAFIDRITTKEKVYSRVEHHKLTGTTLVVRNYAFETSANFSNLANSDSLGDPIPLTSVPSWASLAPTVTIENMKTLLFAYFKMPEANTIDINSPLGVSGFSRAADLIKHADEIYSDLLWELEGGQLAIDVDRTAMNPIKRPDGTIKEVLPKLQDRLFRRNLDLGTDDMYNVFSPPLRDKNIINALNNQLMRIEDACSISRGTLSVVSTSEARTATELKILKQRSYSANLDIQKSLQRALESVFVILEAYCELYNIVPKGDYEVSWKWDDSILIDKDAERQVDMIDVNNGLMSKLEYRMKWYGETEAQAEEALKRIEDEKRAALEMTQSIMTEQQPQNEASGAIAKANDKQKRSIESNEVNKDNKNKK